MEVQIWRRRSDGGVKEKKMKILLFFSKNLINFSFFFFFFSDFFCTSPAEPLSATSQLSMQRRARSLALLFTFFFLNFRRPSIPVVDDNASNSCTSLLLPLLPFKLLFILFSTARFNTFPTTLPTVLFIHASIAHFRGDVNQ